MAGGMCPLESMVSPIQNGPPPGFWQGKRVLITGHTGFKGAWLALWLKKKGAKVTGIALPPSTFPNLFELAKIEFELETSHFCDIRNAGALSELIAHVEPEIVFHLAAQALVRPSYTTPLETYSSNVMGTANLLEALRIHPGTRVAVVITTDKVYHNQDWSYPYRETDELGGHDPYSASKAASELVAASYRDAFLVQQGLALATARAGNVIGGGDWAQDRLIPDAIRAWQADLPLRIRAPQSIRPWQHVLEPLAGYIKLAEQLWQQPKLSGPFNFGPFPQDARNVGEVVELARHFYGNGEIMLDQDANHPHESHTLTLEISKAQQLLGFNPRWQIASAVERTMAWYRAQNQGQNAYALCHADIEAYESIS